MGLSLSIAGYLPIVSLCWVTTKAARFGKLISLGRLDELDALFFRTLRQALVSILILVAVCGAAVAGVRLLAPTIAARTESPGVIGLLLLTAVSSFVVQSFAVYLRSFRKEPYLAQSLAVSAITLGAVWATVPRWGSGAVAVIYFACTGVIGLLGSRVDRQR